MVTIRSCFVCALAVMLGAATGRASDRGGELPGVGSAFGDDTGSIFQAQEAQGVGAGFARGVENRPKLYDNTTVCTVRTKWLAVGADTDRPVKLSIRDWFTTHGGRVDGFDLFLVNAGTVARPISNFEFFDGTDAENRGAEFGTRKFFRTLGSPTLSPVPPNPNNSEWPIKMSVDYVNDTYTLSYGVLNEETGEFEFPFADIEQVLGVGANGRTPFDLPPGKIGIDLRTAGESSVCRSSPGDPKFGPVMALGGEGAVDGVHIIGAENSPDGGCSQGQRGEMPCPGSPEPWDGIDPCMGGDACNFDEPFYSIAMTLYVGAGPDELGDGNNEIATAQVIPRPNVGDGSMSTVHGFLGDNAQSYTGTPVTCFDSDEDGVTVLDYAGFQRCFGDDVPPECGLYDCGGDGNVDLTDYQAFRIAAEGGDPGCGCQIPDPPTLLKDVDVFKVSGLTAGQVMSILLEGSQSPSEGPLWDPALRVFADTGAGIAQIPNVDGGISDDFERLSLDAFTTIAIPENLVDNTLFIGVSNSGNLGYDPEAPASYPEIDPSEAGGYALSIALTDPQTVQDTDPCLNEDFPSNCYFDDPANICPRWFECYDGKHEPDDTMADADVFGHTHIFSPIIGTIGDGAFASIGQDIDIYRIDLTDDNDGCLAPTKSIQIKWVIPGIPGGFETVFDLAVGLYDQDGNLIASSDQVARWGDMGLDHTPPALVQNVETPATYYVAIFGTDRGWFEFEFADPKDPPIGVSPILPAVPPSLLNFPHGPDVAGTNESYLFPTVGGRVNLPGDPLEGPDPDDPEIMLNTQCYKIFILDDRNPAPCANPACPCDDDEKLFQCGEKPNQFPCGNDSIPFATTGIPIQIMLGTQEDPDPPPPNRCLGNGPFGGWQGDADFFQLNVTPGDIIAVHTGDTQQPPINDNWSRAYLVLMDPSGEIIEDLTYSLEVFDETAFFDFTDGIATTVVTTVPEGMSTIYAALSIDAGNLLISENTPFDSDHAGTTLVNRFQANNQQARKYVLAVSRRSRAVAFPVPGGGVGGVGVRMFIAPQRGFDSKHIETIRSPSAGAPSSSFPDILELDPNSGLIIQALPGGAFFDVNEVFLGGFRSTNPIIAYDGNRLWISVDDLDEEGGTQLAHQYFVMNPDSGDTEGLGELLVAGGKQFLSGMTIIDGTIYVLDDQAIPIDGSWPDLENSDNLLSWDALDENGDPIFSPTITSVAITHTDEFDNVGGDLATDGTFIYIDCFLDGLSVGICKFKTGVKEGEELGEFEGIIPNHVSNVNVIPGPRLGGFDIVYDHDRNIQVVVGADKHGVIMEMADLDELSSPKYDPTLATLGGFVMPREFQVIRLASYPHDSDDN